MLAVDLDGKRALVTGANSGIGEAIALQLAEAGADVVVNFLFHPEAAEAVCNKISALGRRAFAVQSDVSDPEQVASMFTRMDTEWGGIDILVNNAGIDGHPALAWQGKTTDWTKVLQVNLFGAYYCCREALDRMVAHGQGAILNMSSVHEVIPWSGYSAYTASKAGLSMMTKTLAQEAAPHGVRVLALAPGAIKTAINQNVWSNPDGLADLNQKIPLGRMGEAAEIAKMATVLMSDLASYATGSTIFVDGGMIDFADFAHGG
ncbi:glucose 1-dehydrogenase [Devosia algicola]|uniref:Glucose 1-dehydrogenase n=1 Tax=Devosia algicola TaxID=3026418 RepID=A0ABY7YNA8_9HYPH|nr:glucose 1-dehydrogenase [Devosia algicola]WDR02667.1 glucose 1-dehydrogenase [Devosia algicola]